MAEACEVIDMTQMLKKLTGMEPDRNMHSGSSGLLKVEKSDRLVGPTELAVARRFRRMALLLLLVGTLDVFHCHNDKVDLLITKN